MSKAISYTAPQTIQRTPTWTKPLQFLQNTVFKGFLTSDKKKQAESGQKLAPHRPLHEKVSYHLDEIEKKRGQRSIKHVLDTL